MPQFKYQGHTYEYEIRRSQRKTLGIYVHPELRIEVRAPHSATLEEIAERIHKRRSWIVKQWQQWKEWLERVMA